MNIAFFEVQDWERHYLEEAFKGHKLQFFPFPMTHEHVIVTKEAEIISTFIYSKIDKKILDHLPRLKLIVTRSTGFDHVDLGECKKRKIMVCNVPSYGENTVAEHTFALILNLSRNIHKAFVRTVRDDFSIEGLKGFDLKGRTIGVVGAGKIGQHVIRIANGFEMNVIVFDRKRDVKLEKQLKFKYVSMDSLLSKSDIITFHVPLTKDTKHLLNKRTIKKCKKGAIVINTSRGEIIETEALLDAINSGMIGGAGLDVIEGENLIKEERELLNHKHHLSAKKLKQIVEDHMLFHNEKVIFTPHIAFYSQEALERILDCTIQDILCFIKNKPQCIVC
jgi:D-lactate dehydrogenase